MRGPFRRAVVAFGAALVLLGPAAGAAAGASASVPGWSITPSPNPVIPTGQLHWVSCPAANSCMAVGTYVRSSGAGVTLAERWDGSRWRIQPVPSPPGAAWSALNGVACSSPSACEAVGVTASRSGAQTALAEGWNGSRWHIQPTPNPAGSPSSRLFAVACPATGACTAVGSSNSKLLVEQWGGSRWRIQSAPVPSGAKFSELNGVTCTAAASCVAVGDYVNRSGADVTLAERWNGTRWTIQATPNPPGAQFSFLNAVSCASASACSAVGGYGNSSGTLVTLAERWNGHAWRLVSAPTPSSPPNSLFIGVACPAPAACIGVGVSFDSSGNPAGTFAERWDGSRWTVQRTPTQHTPGGLLGVWCQSVTACIAVGGTNAGTLAERLTGTTWTVQSTPNPPGTQGDFLTSVSCTSLSACTGFGIACPFPVCLSHQILAERWNGTRWRIQPTPTPVGAYRLDSNAVACPTVTTCMAVGAYTNNGTQVTLAERWNGAGQSAPGAFSPRAFLGMAGCIRAAMGAGSAVGTTHSRIEPKVRTPISPRSQPGSEIERITSLCGAA